MKSLIDQLTEQSNEIVDQIRPLLAGKLPQLQGIVVAELTAIWLAGHAPELRDDLIRMQDAAVRELVTLWHERLRGRQ